MKALLTIAALAATLVGCVHSPSEAPASERPNILLVTVDDMNWNSVGAFGNAITDITPNIDRFIAEGRRFDRAYVAAANCAPSRVALQTGLYPQQTGAVGFFYIDDEDTPSIATELKGSGFFTGVINKASDTNPGPNNADYWDFNSGFSEAEKYSPAAYGERSATFFQQAIASDQPFYLVVNIADPHKPNYNDPEATAMGADEYVPSRLIAREEITVPGFLPDLPEVRQDLQNYYNSVRRADDAFGAIMAALEASGLEDDTLVIFLSDHGMPFPFAKSSVYDNGLRTPLAMRWPEHITPGTVEASLVSTVDLLPTILQAAGVDLPVGRDYLGSDLVNASLADRPQLAFGSFDENARGYPSPMRGVISTEWGYVFNAWADGEHEFRSADMYHASYRAMQRHARTDPAVRQRFEFFRDRTVEELCHLAVDPDCLVNLADNPAHAGILAEMQAAMRAHMVRTDDYLLEAFDLRGDRAQLVAFMDRQHELARARSSRLQWRRGENLDGNTSANEELFRNGQD